MSGRVVVVGSLNLDVVVGVERLPEAGETIIGTSIARHAGGKGLNQAVAVARLGAPVSLIGALGQDPAAEFLAGVVAEEGIDDAGIARVDGPSGTALIEVDYVGQNRIVVIPGANGLVTADHVATSLRALDDVAVVLVQGEIPDDAVEAALRAGRERGALTMLNPAPVRPAHVALLGLVDVVVPNEHEAHEITGLPTATTVDSTEAARWLTDRGPRYAVITRGGRGSVWASATTCGSSGAIAVSAIDTVAAGDAFCGGLAAAFAEGRNIGEAVRWASACGALATTVRGAVPSLPTREAVELLLE
jgi:ribokinase